MRNIEISDTFDDHKILQMRKKDNVDKEKIQSDWEFFQQGYLERNILNLLDIVEESEKEEDWYLVLEKIIERFQDRYKNHFGIKNNWRFLKIDTCIVCQMSPNCLNKYNLTRDEIKKMIF